MDNNSRIDLSPILARLSLIALYIVLGTGLTAIAAGYLVIQSGSSQQTENILLRNIVFVAALIDLASIQYVKRSLLGKLRSPEDSASITFAMLLGPTLIIAAICAAISIYGFIAVIFGSSLDVLLLFVAVSLIGYQLFRIRDRDLKG